MLVPALTGWPLQDVTIEVAAHVGSLAAVMLYPVQMYFIPILQRKVNLLGKERVRLVRRLSDRIGESIAGVEEIHSHDAARFELATFSDRLAPSSCSCCAGRSSCWSSSTKPSSTSSTSIGD